MWPTSGNDGFELMKRVCIVGQSLERHSEDISILMGRGVEMARSEPVQDSVNTLQFWIEQYGQYR